MFTVIIADIAENGWEKWYHSLTEPSFELLGICTHREDLFEFLKSTARPDLLIITDRFAENQSEELIRTIRATSPFTACLLLCDTLTVESFRKAIQAGACEVLSSDNVTALQAAIAMLIDEHDRRYCSACTDMNIDQLLVHIQHYAEQLSGTQVLTVCVAHTTPFALLDIAKSAHPPLTKYWIAPIDADASVLFVLCEEAIRETTTRWITQVLSEQAGGLYTGAQNAMQAYVSALSGYCTARLLNTAKLYHYTEKTATRCEQYLFALNKYWDNADAPQIHNLIDRCVAFMKEESLDLSFFVPFYNLLIQLALREARLRGISKQELPFMAENAVALFQSFPDADRLIIQMHRTVDAVLEIPSQESAYHMDSKHIIKEICKYIRHHPTENLNRRVLATKYYLSEKYLGNLFKQITGQGLTNYINTTRIERAKQLLADTNLTVQNIATLCGYNDYFYFLKVFKRSNGVTPSDYRKEYQQRKTDSSDPQ